MDEKERRGKLTLRKSLEKRWCEIWNSSAKETAIVKIKTGAINEIRVIKTKKILRVNINKTLIRVQISQVTSNDGHLIKNINRKGIVVKIKIKVKVKIKIKKAYLKK